MFEKLEELNGGTRYSITFSASRGDQQTGRTSKGGQGVCELRKVVDLYRKFKKLDVEIEESRHLLSSEEDDEMKRLAKEELDRLLVEKEKVEGDLKFVLIPKDPNDEKNIILEIRAGRRR